jgi:hypothetical protein
MHGSLGNSDEIWKPSRLMYVCSFSTKILANHGLLQITIEHHTITEEM